MIPGGLKVSDAVLAPRSTPGPRAGGTWQRFLLCVGLLLFPTGWGLLSAPLPILSSETSPADPDAVSYYRDDSNRLTLEQVARLPADAWKPVPGGVPNFGFIDGTIWVRLQVVNQTQEHNFVLEFGYALLDHVHVFFFDSPEDFSAARPQLARFAREDPELRCIGDRHPISHRAIAARLPALPFELAPGESRLIVISVRTESASQFPLGIYTREFHAQKVVYDTLIHGLYFGLMIAMITYNLFVAFSSRSLAYLYYVGYVFFTTLFFFCLSGLAYRYSIPPGTFLRSDALPAYVGLFCTCIFLFAERFLEAKRNIPQARKLLFALAGYSFFAAVVSLFVPYRIAAIIAMAPGLVVPFVLLPIALIAWRKGFRPARYYSLAWVILLLAYGQRTVVQYGFIPTSPFVIEYGVLIATGLETMLLALALGDRFRDLERQRVELARLHRDLELARDIQVSLLPRAVPDVPGLKLHPRLRAMETVGGDYYDFRVTEHGIGVLLADVSGHGVPAALVVSSVKLGFWFQRGSISAPDRLLSSMNDILRGNIGGGFVTAAYFYYDADSRQLLMGNAGHPPVLLQRHARADLIELRPFGRVLGVRTEGTYSTESQVLQPGDRILMFSDGLFEQRTVRGELLGIERLYALLEGNRSLTGEGLADHLMEFVIEWVGGAERLRDDVALIVADVTE